MFAIKPGIYSVILDDTIVCRCEEVRLSDIEQAITECAGHSKQVKEKTRAGMGRCQGRYCGMTVYTRLCSQTGTPVENLASLPPRLPTKPVPLRSFLRV